MVTERVDTPWLGDRRGYLIDWLTQRWVQATGKRVDLSEHPWLIGPFGSPAGIGADFFQKLAEIEGLEVLPPDPHSGLMSSFDALAGSGLSPSAVSPRVREFYEHTARFSLDVWSQWSGAFRPFGGLLAALFSRRLQQLNVPLRPLDTSRGMTSSIVRLRTPGVPDRELVGWVRQNPDSGSAVYVGAYSVVTVPGHSSPCVKVVFPLPNGNATVIMRARVEPEGALVLESAGEQFGDPGFYFLVRASQTESWARFLRTFRERIRVFVDSEGVLRTDHTFTIWRRTFLELHYRLAQAAA